MTTTQPNDRMDEREMDEAIHRAMRSGANEPPILIQVTEALSGRTWWFNLIGIPVMFAFVGIAVWSAIRFFESTDTRGMIMWAVIFLVSTQSIAMLKIWYWMLLNRNSVTREVKRLEIQVARLVARPDRV